MTSADLEPDHRPDARELRASMLRVVGADPDSDVPVAAGAQLDALRVAYRRRLLQIAALDLADGLDVAAVSAELADLAAATLDAGLAIAGPACRRTPRRAGWPSSGWANAVAASSTMSPMST